MKIEKRGKYPGVKVHLDPAQCEAMMELAKDVEKGANTFTIFTQKGTTPSYFSVALKIGKKMLAIAQEDPAFLTERSTEEVVASLKKDKEKIEKQLAAGEGWKYVD